MADRSVTVKLRIDNSDFIRGLGQASAAARAFKKSVEDDADFGASFSAAADDADDFAKSTDHAAKSTDKLGTSFRKADTENKRFLGGLNTGNDRMSFLVQTGLALGPALIPTFAALTPVVTGFGTALGITAASAGVAVLAFSGVGDALKALNDYSVDPTVAHLEAMRKAMDELGPAGQDFVRFLQEIRPEMQELQSIAQAGLLPGVQDGIEAVMTQMPLLEELVSSLAQTMGDVSEATGEALTSPFWTSFLEYLRDDGQQILTDFASALGHLVEGLAAMTQAFSPLSEGFIAGFDDMARSFSNWAQGLDQNQGFQDFMDYIREAGPELLDVVDALAEAIVALGHAGAGIGLASLEVIQRFLEGLANVLESPLGPWLLGIAAGLSAISRAVALYKIVAGQALLGLIGGFSGKHVAGPGAAGGMPAVLGSLEKIGYARIAAGLALVATSATDLGDSLGGAENTVNFGLLGFLLKGSTGAGIGVAVGAALDMSAANTDLAESFENLDDAMSDPTDFTAQTSALDALKAKIDEMRADFVTGDDGDLNPLDDLQNMVQGWFGESNLEKAQRVYDEAIAQKEAFLDEYLKTVPGNPFGSLFDITGVAAGAVAALKGIIPAADSGAGRTSELEDAFEGLDDKLLSTADSADALSTALDNLLNPQLDLQEATDAFTLGLRGWEKEIAKSSGALLGNSNAAIKNRASLKSRTLELVAQIKAEARVNDSRREVSKSLLDERERLLRNADAIGLNVGQVETLLDRYHLTEKMLDRMFREKHEIKVEHDAADRALDNVMDALEDINVFDAEPSISLSGGSAVLSAIRVIQGALDALNVFNATPSVSSPDFNLRRQPLERADGGLILGPGGGRDDMVPILASNGEFVVNAAATRENLELLRSINAKKFAGGGQVGRRVSPADLSRSAFRSDLPSTLEQLVRLLGEMRDEARDVVEAEQDVKAAREAARQASKSLAQTEDTTSERYRDRARASREADKELEKAENELSRQRDQLTEATQRWKDKQQELIDQAAAVQAGLLGSGAVLGGDGTSVTVGGILAKIKDAARDGARFRRDIAKIRALGVDESYVRQLLENAGTPEAEAAAHNLANASLRQVRQLNAAQNRLERVAVTTSRSAVRGGGGDNINVRFTGPVTTTDVKRLPAALERRIRRAVRVARSR